MKKIMPLIFILLFITGCYDYSELDELAIVSAVAIDKEDDRYLVTLEILVDEKSPSGGSQTSALIASGTEKTISSAFKVASLSVAKEMYFEHLEAVIISEDIAKEDFKHLVKYLIREPKINNDFRLVIANGAKASEIITSQTKTDPIVGDKIIAMLLHDKSGNNISTNLYYEDLLIKMMNNKNDGYFASIRKVDEETKLGGFAIFDNYQFKKFLDIEKSLIMNILTSSSTNATFDTILDGETLSIKTHKSKSGIKFKDNKFIVSASISAAIVEDTLNRSAKDVDTFREIEEIFKEKLTKEIDEFIKELKLIDSDVLGMNFAYFKATKKNEDIWKSLDYEIKLDVKINKIGLTYEVEL